ncbi:Tat pathway signal sequence domain protein [Streptosporangium sp. NPDC050855]|uniref:exo-rhamnogalacturonan lyase family protein n=1 Tax=Streptosporangium sp. NPDC050855 TaxID=3366194 RepID=UPI0037ABE30D
MTEVRWLDGPRRQGVTWGVPWPRGTVAAGTGFALRDGTPVQSWVTATWPDGSVKWSAHAIGPQSDPSDAYELCPQAVTSLPEHPVTVTGRTIRSGPVTWRLGGGLIESISYTEPEGSRRHGSREIVRNVRLVSVHDDEVTATVERVTVEQDGPVRAVVRVEGGHAGRLPFTVRLYFYAGSPEVRLVHSFVWDGDPERDFLRGLGLRADVIMRDEPHDRHVRLAGPSRGVGEAGSVTGFLTGFLTEAVRGLTGLRRDPGAAVRRAQVEGRAADPSALAGHLHLIPTWSDYTLDQNSADGFLLRKRTRPGRGWVTIPSGTRSQGYGYVGGVSGGLGFGLRDFWKLHPTRLDVRGAATGLATATVWLHSPGSRPMDLRFWHDGLGQESHTEQLEGLEITYEDHEPGYGTPYGIARTHELSLCLFEATPPNEELAERAAGLTPGLLVASPGRIKEAGVFGTWAPRSGDGPIEERLDFLFDHYLAQQEQRRWYGFWDYGDVMHTYDADRHTWRYDVGGYAWDNSELSPDLWLWYQFLRTGRADVFRFAEAMTRHTGEVDVYHLGPWKGLGSRHNVQHWGCSCKQLRISSAIYRRMFYYLTADERTGDLMDELSEDAVAALDPLRKYRAVPEPRIGLGTDWGALAAMWLTRWERHRDAGARDRLLGTMADLATLPHGFLAGEAELRDGRLRRMTDEISLSHLSAVFGLPEVCAELIDLDLGVAGFEEAWLEYCRRYLTDPELRGVSLIQAHSRLAAYAAVRTGDRGLADVAWHAFDVGEGDQLNVNPLQARRDWRLTHVRDASVLMPVDEAPYVSTNDAAQYALAAIQLLALIPRR